MSDIYTLEVINVLGEVLYNKVIEGLIDETFNTSNYNSGIYFIKISNGISENIQKIIIK